MSELLNCPFCGGKAFVDTHKFWDEKAKDFTVQTYGVKCYDCQMGTWQHYRKEDDAIKHWNTRKPMENIVAELEKSKTSSEYEIEGTIPRKGFVKGIDKAINMVKQEINNGLE